MPKIVTICSSANFYAHVNAIAAELKSMGYDVIVPKTARKMAETNDYDISHYKTWFENEADYTKKAELMRAHFDEVSKSDVVLVVNDEKHGIPDYIGPNVLLEMSLGWYLHKSIYLLNAVPSDSPFEEEIKGMNAYPLHGNLNLLP